MGTLQIWWFCFEIFFVERITYILRMITPRSYLWLEIVPNQASKVSFHVDTFGIHLDLQSI